MKKLYIKQKVFKVTDHYAVMDENQQEVYFVDQDFKLIGNTVHVSDAGKRELFVVDRKVMTLLPKYYVNYVDGRVIEIESKLSFFKQKLNINMQGRQLQVKGNFWAHNYDMFDGDSLVGNVIRKLLTWGDTYEITVHDESIEDIVIGLVIALDNIQDMSQNSG